MRKGSVIAEARVGVMYAHGQDWFLKLRISDLKLGLIFAYFKIHNSGCEAIAV